MDRELGEKQGTLDEVAGKLRSSRRELSEVEADVEARRKEVRGLQGATGGRGRRGGGGAAPGEGGGGRGQGSGEGQGGKWGSACKQQARKLAPKTHDPATSPTRSFRLAA